MSVFVGTVIGILGFGFRLLTYEMSFSYSGGIKQAGGGEAEFWGKVHVV